MHRASPDLRPLLVGAMARDVLLSFAHGIPLARATQDMDFAFALESWDGFSRMRRDLLASGDFTDDPRGVAHRLIYEHSHRMDLIPFGGMEREDRSIAWPPEHDVVMQVVGFREALANARKIQLPEGAVVDVASLPAQAVLKLFAWRDRRTVRPGVDAGDLRWLLSHYLDAGNQERLYTDAAHFLAMERYDYHCASAWLIGYDARQLLQEADDSGAMAIGTMLQMLASQIDPDGQLTLAVDMRSGDVANALDLLTAFEAGLRDSRLI